MKDSTKAVLALLLVSAIFGWIYDAVAGDDESESDSTTEASFLTCPGALEEAGPFVSGEPGYDPAMDWDDDGVSCE